MTNNEIYQKINHLPKELMPALVAYLDFLLKQHPQ